MDINTNQLKFNQQYIQPNTITNSTNQQEFETFYQNEQIRKQQEQQQKEAFDDNRVERVNKLIEDLNESGANKVIQRFTTVNIDTRDANIDKNKYPNPNHFKISLGEIFQSVQSIELIKIEFPNTNAVINESNRYVYWRNQEDIDLNIIDPITKVYPVYSVQLRIGSYTLTSLEDELTNKMNAVQRRNKTGVYHYFVVNLDQDTSIVSFESLFLQYIGNNAITSVAGSGLLTITAPSHGLTDGETVSLLGAQSFAGIDQEVLNGHFPAGIIDENTFTIQVNIQATASVSGGGNLLNIGKQAPFQFLFGENTNTVAPNIGFPDENSSLRIDTEIDSIRNMTLLKITTVFPHNLDDNVLGSTIQLNSVITQPNILNDIGSRRFNEIVSFPSSTEITMAVYLTDFLTPDIVTNLPIQTPGALGTLQFPVSLSVENDFYVGWIVSLNNANNEPNFAQVRKIIDYNGTTQIATVNSPYPDEFGGSTPQIRMFKYPEGTRLIQESIRSPPSFLPEFVLNGIVYPIESVRNYTDALVKVTTKTLHGYTSLDSKKTIQMYNTDSVPNFNGNQQIISIPGKTQIVLRGSVLGVGSTGNIPRNKPLTTGINYITGATPGTLTIFECIGHPLKVGDMVLFYNITSTPSMLQNAGNRFQVATIPDSDHFSIDFNTSSIQITKANQNEVPNTSINTYIGHGILELEFPGHQFNEILSIVNGAPGEVIVTTFLNHNLTTNDQVTIGSTDSVPSVDGSYNVNIINQKQFALILYTPSPLSGVLESQAGALSDTLILPTSVGSNFFVDYFIKITSGGAKDEYKLIVNQGGSPIITITVDSDWVTQPAQGDSFILYEVAGTIRNSIESQSGLLSNQIRLRFLDSNFTLMQTGTYIKLIRLFGMDTILTQVVSIDDISPATPSGINVTATVNKNMPDVSIYEFIIFPPPVTTSGTTGSIGLSNDFYLYGSGNIGGIPSTLINDRLHSIRDIIDENKLTFVVEGQSNTIEKGGVDLYISSLKHGFSGIQINTKNDVLNRSINLEGENYVFLCCPQLSTILNTGKVSDIFARITLDVSPGSVVFSSLGNTISPPKNFENQPLSKLSDLEFTVKNYDGTLYNFNDLGWSMVLQIQENIYSDNSFNISSKTGK